MEYRFVTVWRIEAPLEAVCEAISHSLHWPQWWRNVESVEELAPGDISPAQACLFVTQARERFNSTAEQAEPAVAPEVAAGEEVPLPLHFLMFHLYLVVGLVGCVKLAL